MCIRDSHDPAHGARGITGVFAAEIYPQIARQILQGAPSGRLQIDYAPGAGISLGGAVAA